MILISARSFRNRGCRRVDAQGDMLEILDPATWFPHFQPQRHVVDVDVVGMKTYWIHEPVGSE